MWHELLAYLIIAAAFAFVAWRIYRTWHHAAGGSPSCADCTADCKLRGLSRPKAKEKKAHCRKKTENRPK